MQAWTTRPVETLRRELVGYGAVISNLANVAQKERMEVAVITKNLIAAVSTEEITIATNANTDVNVNTNVAINVTIKAINVAISTEATTLSRS